MNKNKQIILAGMLLALMIVLQLLRLFFPFPVIFTVFAVGSILNSCLLLSVELCTVTATILLSVLAPVIAYLEGALFFPIMIVPIMIINLLYTLSYTWLRFRGRIKAIFMASVVRVVMSYFSSMIIFKLIQTNTPIVKIMVITMSWPQFITGIIGGGITLLVIKMFKSPTFYGHN